MKKRRWGCRLSSRSAHDSCSRVLVARPTPADVRPAGTCTILLAWADRTLPWSGFDRRLLALWQVHSRRLRPAGRRTCRVRGRWCTMVRECLGPKKSAVVSRSTELRPFIQFFTHTTNLDSCQGVGAPPHMRDDTSSPPVASHLQLHTNGLLLTRLNR